jgi:hypothetical protein
LPLRQQLVSHVPDHISGLLRRSAKKPTKLFSLCKTLTTQAMHTNGAAKPRKKKKKKMLCDVYWQLATVAATYVGGGVLLLHAQLEVRLQLGGHDGLIALHFAVLES